jgi:DNA-binding NarL/FixJ family response regulator
MIRILLADDHRMLRDSLRSVLEDTPDMAVVAEAEDGLAAVALAAEHAPDVILMDISMPGLNGIEATRKILAAQPQIRVIALTMNTDRLAIENMLGAGAAGFVLKTNAFEELVNAIRAVTAGRTFLCPEIAAIAVNDFVDKLRGSSPAERAGLTKTEINVLALLGAGRSSKEIAAELDMSIRTADAHRANISQKLNTSSMAELTKHAIKFGLTSLD